MNRNRKLQKQDDGSPTLGTEVNPNLSIKDENLRTESQLLKSGQCFNSGKEISLSQTREALSSTGEGDDLVSSDGTGGGLLQKFI